jgi:hypothetical protein
MTHPQLQVIRVFASIRTLTLPTYHSAPQRLYFQDATARKQTSEKVSPINHQPPPPTLPTTITPKNLPQQKNKEMITAGVEPATLAYSGYAISTTL